MLTHGNDNVVHLQPDEKLMKRAFLGWQCRLRQLSMRDNEGRPGEGMRPKLEVAGQDAGTMTVVITKDDSEESMSEFRYIVKRTHDPKERFEAALRYFQSSYFQDPMSFSDEMTAVLGMNAMMPAQITGRKDCILTFKQFGQVYELACRANLLAVDHPRFQATYWHNALFNPSIPAGVQIVGFSPDWSKAKAEPAPVR